MAIKPWLTTPFEAIFTEKEIYAHALCGCERGDRFTISRLSQFERHDKIHGKKYKLLLLEEIPFFEKKSHERRRGRSVAARRRIGIRGFIDRLLRTSMSYLVKVLKKARYNQNMCSLHIRERTKEDRILLGATHSCNTLEKNQNPI